MSARPYVKKPDICLPISEEFVQELIMDWLERDIMPDWPRDITIENNYGNSPCFTVTIKDDSDG